MEIMKYRIFALMGLMAMLSAPLVQAQDYDDIYYDASSTSKETTTVIKAQKPTKTVAVYGEVPERYKVAAKSNYSLERDEDEYNRRGAYEPDYAVSIDGDTIYDDDEAFANTRRIERFYNPDIVILSDDDDLVELYYDESPTINLIVGSDYGYGASYGWASSYYPWYTGYYYPWYTGWYDPWYYSPYYYSWYSPYYWGWGYHPWHYTHWGHTWWSWGGHPYGWNNWYWGDNWAWGGHSSHHYADWGRRGHSQNSGIGTRAGLAQNRNHRTHVGATTGGSRKGISSRAADGTGSRVGTTGTRTRGGYATTRGGNIGTRGTGGVTSRSAGVSRSSSGRVSGYSGGSRSSSGSYSGGSRSSSGSYSGGSRSSGGSYSGGSRSSGGSHSSGGSYSSGSSSRGSSGGGGGSRGGSSGGGGRRR